MTDKDLTNDYYEEAIKRIQGWIKSGGPDYIAIHTELKTFYDLGFKAGYERAIERYGYYPLSTEQSSTRDTENPSKEPTIKPYKPPY